ncbi:MAG: hypothetical protein C4520_18255 [Candidatus Abyssobacteria bacterium SURF_5]|uniref:Uncharacterized protein n=1 Tax=Abyssobacteria bacterium (strain SURF_5) TaxID=2093360 RepID=A0A3A4N3M4_ABYX5|nr:MAG: hypothetical protein C4520_18255 [Candidatus Abyssubacteria bacterium SURF_5]
MIFLRGMKWSVNNFIRCIFARENFPISLSSDRETQRLRNSFPGAFHRPGIDIGALKMIRKGGWNG